MFCREPLPPFCWCYYTRLKWDKLDATWPRHNSNLTSQNITQWRICGGGMGWWSAATPHLKFTCDVRRHHENQRSNSTIFNPSCWAAPAARKHSTLQTLNLYMETVDPVPSPNETGEPCRREQKKTTKKTPWHVATYFQKNITSGRAFPMAASGRYGHTDSRQGCSFIRHAPLRDVHRGRHAESFDPLPIETTIPDT